MAEHKLKTKTPWKTKDPAATTQKLVVHLGTPVLAAVVVMFSDISGRSGFLVTWLLMHLVTGGLLAKFGKDRTSFANSAIEVLTSACVVIFIVSASTVLVPVFTKGINAFRSNLLFQDASTVEPGADLLIGGILHAIVGTLLIVGMATIISVPIGILAALYVTEVRGRLTPFVRFFVQAMSGVPSIVAGLFIYAALVVTGLVPFSGLSGALALSILMLPTVARTAEEVLLLVPDDLRTAALALGSTQRRVVRMVVLPAAGPGLVTASILGIARVAGETAPLLLTAFGTAALNLNPLSEPMSALPLFIFTQMLLGEENDVARAWFAAMVLMLLVTTLFVAARLMVSRSLKNRSI